MKNKTIFLLWIIMSSAVVNIFAQETQTGSLRITWPLNRTVLQQDANGKAKIRFFAEFQNDGNFGSLGATNYQYRIFNVDPATGAVGSLYGSDWQLGNVENVTRYYNAGSSEKYLKLLSIPNNTGNLELPKGWYKLEVRLVVRKATSIKWKQSAITSIKFGVGDVFIIYGQSNAAGYDPTDDKQLIPFANSYSSKDAISSINYSMPNNSTFKLDGMPMVGYSGQSTEGFNKLEKTSKIYPRGFSSWCWGPMAEKYINDQTFKQPILFLNAAVPGREIASLNNLNSFEYKTFRSVLQMQGSILGNKGVLWHQGEEDAKKQIDGTVQDFSYYSTQLKNLIEQSRKDLGIANVMNNNLTWNVSKASYFSFPDQNKDSGQEYFGIPFVIHNGNPPTTTGDQNYGRYCPSCPIATILPISPVHLDFQDYNSSLNTAQNNYSGLTNVRMGISTDDLGQSSRGPHRAIHLTNEALSTVGQRWKDSNPTAGIAIESKIISNYTSVVKQSNGSYKLTAPAGFDRYFWVSNNNGIYSKLNTDLTSREYITQIPTSAYISISCYMGKSTGQPIGDETNGWNLVFSMTHPFILPGYAGAKALSAQPVSQIPAAQTQVTVNVTGNNLTWEADENESWFSLGGITGGGDGITQLTLNIDANTLNSSRIGYLNITEDGGGLSQTLTITQAAATTSGCTATSLLSRPAGATIGNWTANATTINTTPVINGVSFVNGGTGGSLSALSDCSRRYNLGGGYTTFTGKVGRDDSQDGCNCANMDMGFQIINVDNGQVLFNSVLHGVNSPAQAFSVNVAGVQNIELRTLLGSDGYNWGDLGNWVELMLNCSTPPTCTVSDPIRLSASTNNIMPGTSVNLTTSCTNGTPNWSTGGSGNSITVNPASRTTYTVFCNNGLNCTSGSVEVTVNVLAFANQCSAVTDYAIMGNWNNNALVVRKFQGQFWLTQRVETNPERFAVRASQMLQWATLVNPSYSSLTSCFSHPYSGYNGLVTPTSSVFSTPVGFSQVFFMDGTPNYLQNTNTSPPNYLGYLDWADCGSLSGWAWNSANPAGAVTIEILEGANVVATGTANIFRADLL